MEEIVENKVSKLKQYGEKPIGVFGARASGKTMFFTILYGLTGFKEDENQFSVLCKDEETRKYLSNNYSYVSKGDLLPRTEITLMRKIVMDFVFNQGDYSLKSFDFAGELLKENSMEEKVLADVFLKRQKKIYEFFASCSGILIFLDPSDDDDEAFKRQDEVNKLLGYLKDENGAWSKSIPIAVVITKWDKISEGKNEVVEKKKAIDYVQNHKVYKNIYNILTGASDTVDIFPISAFGESKDGDLPPDDLNQPFNVFAPLVWISNKRDVDWKNKIKNLFKEEKVNKKDAKDIVRIYLENVKNPEHVKEIEKIYKKYKAKSRNKVVAIIVFLILLVAGGATGYYYNNMKNKEGNEFDIALKIQDKEKQLEAIKNFIIKYGDENENSKKLSEKKRDVYKDAIALEKDPRKKKSLIEQFKTEYQDPSAVEFATTELAKVEEEIKQAVIAEQMKKSADEAYETLQKQLQTTGESSLNKYRYAKAFASNYPDFKYITTVKENIDKYMKLAEKEMFDDIADYTKNQNNNTNTAYEKIAEYLSISDFKEYRKKVTDIKNDLREEELFGFVKSSKNNYNEKMTNENILDLLNAAKSYRKDSTSKKYNTIVSKYIQKIEELQKGLSMEMELYADVSSVSNSNMKVEMKVEFVNGESVFKSKEDVNGKEKGLSYIGAAETTIGIGTKANVTVYVMDANKKEYQYGPISLDFAKLSQPLSVKSKSGTIKIEVRIDKGDFKIK